MYFGGRLSKLNICLVFIHNENDMASPSMTHGVVLIKGDR